ncbi:NusA-like transcription termination signal-binding factor [Candidatus Woesearchaeota archaeon]|nr:NusA-like transcription termination signal-binding factor [Candidatus Woesearchaeota archaeon]
MTRIKYDADLMNIIRLFENMTGAKLKDCISNERIVFIVEENEIGRAIGKHGVNIKRLENMLKKKIKVIEFSQNVLQFIKNLLYPLQVLNIENNDNIITITGPDTKTKGLIIGRNKQNLNNLISAVKRYFDVGDIRVV